MTLNEIATYRLHNQQIAGTTCKTAGKMISWFAAVQAQEYAQTKWSIGLRLPGLKDDELEKDITQGRILRTHLLRPTWHFVVAEDIRWMLDLTAPRVHAANAFMYKKLELDTPVFNRCKNIISKTLQGNKHVTRDILKQAFKRKNIIADGHRLSYIMMCAELDGIVCSGARQGKQFTYALLEERVPAFKSKTREEGLSELTRRYFLSRGPATIRDFSTWSGLTLPDCRKGLSMVENDFTPVRVDQQDFYFSPDILSSLKPFPDICLLPVYDEYIMGYKDRAAMAVWVNSIKPRPLLQFDNMIIFKGQIIGTWKRTIQTKGIRLEYNFFRPLLKTQVKAFADAVSRLSEFTNLPVNDYVDLNS